MSLTFRLWLILVILCGPALAPKAAAQYQKSALELQSGSLLADLHRQGVDTICVYEAYCVGCRGFWVAADSPCRTKGILIPTYFFWKQAGRTYARKLDNCSLGAVKEAPHTTFWPYFFAHSEQIKKEEIKEFVTASHGSIFAFSFYVRADTVEQYFHGIDLHCIGSQLVIC